MLLALGLRVKSFEFGGYGVEGLGLGSGFGDYGAGFGVGAGARV